MAKAFSSFFPEVLINAPELPNITAEIYLRDAAIKFCNLTHVVIEELDAVTVSSGTSEVSLQVAAQEEISALVSVYRGGYPIEPLSDQDLRVRYGDWKDQSGTVSHYTATGNVIRLFKIPDADIELVATVAKRPTQDATTLNDLLFDEWKSAIVSGALAGILMIPGKTFTNPNLAMVHKTRFNDDVISAQGRAIKQTHRAPLRTHSRFW